MARISISDLQGAPPPAVNVSAGPPLYELPDSQRARLEAIRARMLQDMAEAVEDLDQARGPAARALARDLQAAAQIPNAAQRRARVRRLLKKAATDGADELSEVIQGLWRDAEGYVDRYERTLAAYRVRERLNLKDLPGPGDVKAIADYEAYYLSSGLAAPGAHAAVVLAARQLGPAPAPAAVAKVRAAALNSFGLGLKNRITAGDKLAKELAADGMLHPYPKRGAKWLSSHLHGQAVADSAQAERHILRAVRESENVARAGRELNRALRAAGRGAMGGQEKIPALLEELLEAGRALSRRGGPEALEQWAKVRADLQRYQRRLKGGGRVQGAYVELLEQLTRPKFKLENLGQVVSRWTTDKQRFRAEVHIRTQQAAAYRAAQVERDIQHRPWIVGYIWRMHRSSHARFVARRPGRLKKIGGRHCICEVMNNKRISVETAQEYESGGHPHCACSFEPIYSRAAMLSAPITDQELAMIEAGEL